MYPADTSMKRLPFYKEKARAIRKKILKTSAFAHSPHVGSCLSPVEVLTALYFRILRLSPVGSAKNDAFILSKGHGGLCLYATLVERGIASEHILKNYGRDGTRVAAHPVRGSMPGIEATTGSLGHGLAMGVGLALAAKRDKTKRKIFVMVSDGECDEGSLWEAVLAAAHHKLDNLTVFIDYNKIQSFGSVQKVMNLEPLLLKWKSFGWAGVEIDGHDFREIFRATKKLPIQKNKPNVIVCHTVKGKGVSFMENTLDWHYKNLTDELLEKALREIS